ncbi:hypothetical protein CFP56_040874 [Quercus suber]|uniref:Uncharacterized protein n=1 Tax=Quercus suber TaxID=58331 RepID=A0AAW0IXY8_QUESU
MPTSNTKSLLVDRITVMGPPLEQCTDPNPVKLSDLTRNNLSPDCLGIGGEVVVRRESDLAVAAKLDGEVSTELDGEVARGLDLSVLPVNLTTGLLNLKSNEADSGSKWC